MAANDLLTQSRTSIRPWSYPVFRRLMVQAGCLVHWLPALSIATVMFLVELVIALAFTCLIGLSTPGSLARHWQAEGWLMA
jgi:hypothetical protein